MNAALVASLVFTTVLLVVHGYFLAGSVPLLVLKHDVPMDFRFVRGFYDLYYRAATWMAAAVAASYALAGRSSFAGGALVLALLAGLSRRTVLPRMDSLREQLQGRGKHAVAAFRRIQVVSILANVAQLALIVWSLLVLSLQLKP